MTGLSQMPQLIDLNIWALHVKSAINCNQLKQIGVNCGQLKRLSLNASIHSCELMSQFIQTMNANFKQLKRLQLDGGYPKEFVFSSESLSECKRLTYFTLIPWTRSVRSAEDFTRDVDQHLPRIQYIKMMRGTDITDTVLNSLAKLPGLRYIDFYGCDLKGTEQAIHNLIANCPKIICFIADKKYV